MALVRYSSVFVPLCSPNTCKDVFNPNVIQSNCAEGLHFSAFQCICDKELTMAIGKDFYTSKVCSTYGMGHKKVPSMRLLKKRILTVPRKRNVRKTARCVERACNGKLNGACNGKLNGACND